ncbi:MAG: hypothetical protein AAF725_11265 [Acidobacteriota bacterium]
MRNTSQHDDPQSHPRKAAGPAARRRLAVPSIAAGLLAALILTVAGESRAQDPQAGGDIWDLVITTQTLKRVRVAFPAAKIDPSLTGDALQAAREVEQTLRDDLDQMILFNVQGTTELSVLVLTGDRDQDFDQYISLGNQVVLQTEIKMEDGKLVLDGWVNDLPSRQSILGKRYRGTLEQARLIAHYLSNALHYQFSGRPSLTLTTLAFQSDRDGFQELHLMDYDGRNQRRISGHKSTSGYSDWSPAGERIAYMSYFAGPPGLYYVDLASGSKVPIYREGTLNLSPSFSPDGSRLAFASSQGSNVDIYTCPIPCSTPVRLTRSRAIDTNPAWSPDGSKIAFTSSRSGRPNIYVMDADGSNVRRVTFEGDYNDGATWSPDSLRMAYASRHGRKFKIAITNLVDLQTTLLTNGEDSYEEPTFSPDGSKIAFTVRRGSTSQVYVMNRDGSDWRQLTHQGNSSGPSWSNFPRQ